MVRRVDKKTGAAYHEPPYTWEEEMDFYRRIGGGPKAILHGAPRQQQAPTKPPPPEET